MIRAFLLLAGCAAGPPTRGDTDSTDPEVEVREWVQLESYPCALDSAGAVACWSGSKWSSGMRMKGLENGIPQTEPAKQIIFGGYLQMLTLTGRVKNLFCWGGGGQCEPPSDEFAEIGIGWGLTTDGRVLNWDGRFAGHPDWTHLPFSRTWTLIDPHKLFVALDDHGRLVGKVEDGSLVEVEFPPDRDYVELAANFHTANPHIFGGCVLDTDGEILCRGDGFGAYEFVNPPYQLLRSTQVDPVACASRVRDGVIECSNGREYDFGPIRDFSLNAREVYDDSGWDPTPGLSVCVITAGNEIRCEGPRYPPDLLELLASLPR